MKRFIPVVSQIPVVFVMSEIEVRGIIPSGLTKSQFDQRLRRKLRHSFDRSEMRSVDAEPYVDEDSLEWSPIRLIAMHRWLMENGNRLYNNPETPSWQMRVFRDEVNSWMASKIAKYSRNTRRVFQSYFNNAILTERIEKIRTTKDYEQYLVTREARHYEFAKPVPTGEWVYQYPAFDPYNVPMREVIRMMSTHTHPRSEVKIRVRNFRLTHTFQGQLPISVLRSWLQTEHPEKTPDSFYMRIIKKDVNHDLRKKEDELAPFTKYSGYGDKPSCTIKIVPLSEYERVDEEENVTIPWWFSDYSWGGLLLRILLFITWTWRHDLVEYWRRLPTPRNWREEERELRIQGRWHLGPEEFGMGLGMRGYPF